MASPCPDLEHLEARVAGRITSAELDLHVEACAACRERSDEIRADNRLLSSVVSAIAAPPPADPDAAAAAAPLAIEGYDVVRELHRGGQGVVFEALHRATQRRVALKVLVAGALATPQQQARFEREIETVLRLRHPHVVTVYDRGTTRDGRAWFAMEFVDGVALDAFVAARRAADAGLDPGARTWTERAALGLFLKVCAAVSYAHQRGVIHRDLKPDNVLVDAAGEPRVLDFGLAKATAEDAESATLTRDGLFLGTLAFASPEQLRGDPDLIDVRTDVYSLGVMLFELLVGARIHPDARTLPALARAIAEQDPAFPSGFDDELRAILERALAKEREHRYSSAAELGRDLERHLRGEPVDAKQGRLGYLLRKALRRHWLPTAAAALVLVVVVVASFVSTVWWRRAAEDARQARIDAGTRARVARFVEEMLGSLNPDRAKGRTVTVREVVDDAARRIDRELAGEPEMEAELRTVLGRTYGSLGLPDEAQAQFERALALTRAATPAPAARIAAVLDDLAVVALQRGDFARGEALDLEALALLESLDDPPAGRLAPVLNNLALQRFGLGQPERALPAFERALALLRAGGRWSDLAASLCNVGRVLLEQERYADAEARLRASIALGREHGDPERRTMAIALHHLVDLLEVTGRDEEARSCLEEALAIERKLLGPDDPWTVLSAVSLALKVLQEDGREAAEPWIEEALARRAALAGKETTVAASALHSLGILEIELGDQPAAERDLRESLARFERLHGRDHPDVAAAQDGMCRLLNARGRFGEAERCGRESVALFRAASGAGSVRAAQASFDLAWSLAGNFRLDEAERWMREALAAFTAGLGAEARKCGRCRAALAWFQHLRGADALAEKACRENLEEQRVRLGERDRDVAWSVGALSEMVEGLGRADEAEALYREGIELQRELVGEESLEFATSVHRLGRLLVRRGRLDEALEPLEQALEIRRAKLGDGHLHLLYSLNTTGVCHMRRGEVDDAAPLFDEAVEMARRVLDPSHPDVAISLANLATLKTARGEDAEAGELLRASYAILRRVRGERHPDTRSVADLLAANDRKRGLEAAPPPEAER